MAIFNSYVSLPEGSARLLDVTVDGEGKTSSWAGVITVNHVPNGSPHEVSTVDRASSIPHQLCQERLSLDLRSSMEKKLGNPTKSKVYLEALNQ